MAPGPQTLCFAMVWEDSCAASLAGKDLRRADAARVLLVRSHATGRDVVAHDAPAAVRGRISGSASGVHEPLVCSTLYMKGPGRLNLYVFYSY